MLCKITPCVGQSTLQMLEKNEALGKAKKIPKKVKLVEMLKAIGVGKAAKEVLKIDYMISRISV